jgi:hypothetical protein
MWTKLTTLFQLTGAVLTIPVGLAGVYSAYLANLSTEVACQNLRTSILGTLERQVDVSAKRILVQKDMAAFERACAQSDPDAKAVFAALDRTILFAPKTADATPEPRDSAPVRFVPPPPPRPFKGPLHQRHWEFENRPRGI